MHKKQNQGGRGGGDKYQFVHYVYICSLVERLLCLVIWMPETSLQFRMLEIQWPMRVLL